MPIVGGLIAALLFVFLVSRVVLLLYWVGSRATQFLKRKKLSATAVKVWANTLSLGVTTFLLGHWKTWDGPPDFAGAFSILVGPTIAVLAADLAWIKWRKRHSS